MHRELTVALAPASVISHHHSVDKTMSPGLCVCWGGQHKGDVVAVPVLPALGNWRQNSEVQVHLQYIVSRNTGNLLPNDMLK